MVLLLLTDFVENFVTAVSASFVTASQTYGTQYPTFAFRESGAWIKGLIAQLGPRFVALPVVHSLVSSRSFMESGSLINAFDWFRIEVPPRSRRLFDLCSSRRRLDVVAQSLLV